MPILNPITLRVHVVNVDHGDAIILEFPDYDWSAHFGIIDTGRPGTRYKFRLTQYLNTLISLRDKPAKIEFVCISHPHEDHYGGLKPFLGQQLPTREVDTITALPDEANFSNQLLSSLQ